MLNAHGSEMDKELAVSLGAFEWLRKPADIEVLADTLRGALRMVRGSRGDPENTPSG